MVKIFRQRKYEKITEPEKSEKSLSLPPKWPIQFLQFYFTMKKIGTILLSFCICALCLAIRAQSTRTEFVYTEPYPQEKLFLINQSMEISLNGRVKKVEQTSNVRKVTFIPGGRVAYVGDYCLYTFDTMGNIKKYVEKRLELDDTVGIPVSKKKALPLEFFNAKKDNETTGPYKMEEEKYSFKDDRLVSIKKDYQTTELEYDEQGKLVRMTEYYFRSYRTTHFNLNENGQLVSISSSRSKKDNQTTDVFCYDAQGNCVVHSKRFDNGWRRDIYEYDESGNRIFEGRCEKFNKKNLCDCKESFFNHGYEYDDQHHVTRDYLIGDWKPRGWDYYYQYDLVGREIEFKIYETNGKERTFRAHIVSSYDSIGRIVSKEALSGTFFINEAFARYTRNAIHQTWEYDTYGNLLLEKVYQDESGPFRVLKYTYEYDGHGNWIKRCRYEGDSEDVLELTETLERVISYY